MALSLLYSLFPCCPFQLSCGMVSGKYSQYRQYSAVQVVYVLIGSQMYSSKALILQTNITLRSTF